MGGNRIAAPLLWDLNVVNRILPYDPQILPQSNRLRPDEISFAFHWAGISQGRQITQTPMNVRWRLRNPPG